MAAPAPFRAMLLTAVLVCGVAACGLSSPGPSPSVPSVPTASPSVTVAADAAVRVAARIPIADGPSGMLLDPSNELYTSDRGAVVITDIDGAGSGQFPWERVVVGDTSGDIALDSRSGLLYVATQDSRGVGTVTVVNIDRHLDTRTGQPRQSEVVDTIALDQGGQPDQLDLDLQAGLLFVLGSDSLVSVIDTRSREVTDALQLGYRDGGGRQHIALGLAVDARAGTAIVSSTARSWLIDTRSLQVKVVDTDGGGPVTVDSTTQRAFIPNEGDGTVTVVDTATGKVVGTIAVGFHSGSGPVTVDPKTALAYLPVVQGGNLVVIDTRKLEVMKRLPPPEASRQWGDVVVDPSTGFLYVKAGGEVLLVTDV